MQALAARRMVKDRELLTQLLLCFIDEPEKVDALVENLLNRRGSLRYLCETSLDQLNKVVGLPPNAAFLLANFQGILTAERLSLLEHKPLSTAERAEAYFAAHMALLLHEKTLLVSLNERLLPLAVHTFGSGHVDRTVITPPGVLAAALRAGASAVLIGHNHPSGSVVPSVADVEVTKELIDVLSGAGIPLIDHILVANGQGISLRAMGIFEEEQWVCQGPCVPPLAKWIAVKP